MERREAIKRTAAIMGGVIFAPSIFGVLNGCTPTGETWRPVLFNRAQADVVKALSETIIPETDTAGANEVGVPGFIEKMVNDVYTIVQRDTFIEGLNRFIEECIIAAGKSFNDLSDDDKFQYAYEMNQLAIENEQTVRPQFFLQFKELTMVGYFTSEIGATQVLRYEPVPGFYNGCMPLEEVGRTWAT